MERFSMENQVQAAGQNMAVEPDQAQKVEKSFLAVEIMEGVTFSTLLVLFSYLYVVIATSTFFSQ